MGQHNVRTTKFSSAMEILPFVFLGRVVRVYRGTAEILEMVRHVGGY